MKITTKNFPVYLRDQTNIAIDAMEWLKGQGVSTGDAGVVVAILVACLIASQAEGDEEKMLDGLSLFQEMLTGVTKSFFKESKR